MWIGNVMLLVINLPMIGMWVKLLQVPYKYLYPSILIFCCIGVYSLNNNVFDVYQTIIFAIFGVICNKLKMEPAPLLIGFVLGPMMEEHLRRAMLLSRGDPVVFIERPISASMLAIGAVVLGAMLLPNLRKGKDAAMSG
jgi:TctA family transporter